MRALLADPEDTSQVFRIISALSGDTSTRIARRMHRSAAGRRLLAAQPSLIARLRDTPTLRGLPADSLGRGYLAFCEREGITPDGLVDASERGYPPQETALAAADAFVADRMRDAHDLWHVVTGYHGDLVGEASLLGFTFAQTFNRGVGLIVAVALLEAREPLHRRLILDGFRRGRRAVWLPGVEWEELLGAPLESVRAWLAVSPPPSYPPVRASELEGPLTAL